MTTLTLRLTDDEAYAHRRRSDDAYDLIIAIATGELNEVSDIAARISAATEARQ